MIPKGYERIDIVADTYREQSLKNPERLKRGTSSRVMVQPALSKMPRNFKDFSSKKKSLKCLNARRSCSPWTRYAKE